MPVKCTWPRASGFRRSLRNGAEAVSTSFLTLRANFWSTLSIVMHRFSANTKTHTGIRGAISISVIRISGHNVRAGNGA